MRRTPLSIVRKWTHLAVRQAVACLPQAWRFRLARSLVRCDPAPDPRLTLKIAETQDELEACFRILHDSYVAAGFMKPDPSGLRVTPYHALPTTTTLCAKWDGRVVGTISIIREGVFGFPLQSVFDLSPLRAVGGNITEVSSLAVDPAFRKTGGQILFPLMKFMREYARNFFDTRHLVIAVNPNKIEMYEALLCFERLKACEVDAYDFANGAPAVGATLDLAFSDERTRALYAGCRRERDLHHYLYVAPLANIQPPPRPLHTTNDPVLTPALMDHFFNRRTQVFSTLDDRKRLLLRSIYDLEAYASVLPPPAATAQHQVALRQHQRFSIRCPATLHVASYDGELAYELTVVEVSMHGLQAECAVPLPEGTQGRLQVAFGDQHRAQVPATAVRRQLSDGRCFYRFQVSAPDVAWRRCVTLLSQGRTHQDLRTWPAGVAGVAGMAPAPAAPVAAGQNAAACPVLL
jgi:hypothetical protein